MATVLDAGDGPVLCLGAVAASDPPQCDGPEVADWDCVELPVVHDDGSIQAWVDQEYGGDVVEVTSALTPTP